MRTIKFRAWDKKRPQMINHIERIEWSWNGTPIVLKSMYDLDVQNNGQNSGDYERDAPDFALMQFTGLFDKNGKEIFEHDLLLVFDQAIVPITDEGQGPIEECNHIVSVEMRDGVWGFEIPRTDDGETGWYGLNYWNTDISDRGYEVIGNIYETPELIQTT